MKSANATIVENFMIDFIQVIYTHQEQYMHKQHLQH